MLLTVLLLCARCRSVGSLLQGSEVQSEDGSKKPKHVAEGSKFLIV